MTDESIMKTKMKNTLTVAALSLATGTLLAAEPGVSYNNPPPDRQEQVFRAGEFSLDVFGTGSVGEETIKRLSNNRIRSNGRLGAGLGANYFFNRYFGLAAEAYSENTGHSFVDNASGSLVFRIPIESIRLAPYVFGGGGYQFDPIEQAFFHAGAGLEYRFLHNVGVFVDARYVATEDSKDFGLGRLGFRFSF